MLKETEEQFGIKITFSVESEPLGTGESISARARASMLYWLSFEKSWLAGEANESAGRGKKGVR